TIHIGDRRIRIWGIAAPELHEPGGREAKTYMAELVALGRVSCIDSGGRSHNRIVAMCSVRRLDLGAEMVGSGLARDCPAFSGGIYGPIE
ncbi:thermonuclease family protein, partial [Salmonella enterica]|uniref:thermonuclease family protein n=1 Tax=Salmonella enterica TaxID=28901 RepID=UPI003D2D6FD0